MRIGIYTSAVAVRPGYEHIVSGHVQIPLHSARLLAESGHEVCLISTEHTPEKVLPACMPDAVPVHYIANMSSRRTALSLSDGRSRIVRVINMLRATIQLRRLAKAHKLDVVHFFGGTGTAQFAGFVRLLGMPCPVIMTLNVGEIPARYSRVTRFVLHRLDRVITSTLYFQKLLAGNGITARLVRHGIVRDMQGPAQGPRNRVLFWREASPLNGGDIGLEVFRRLASRFPDINFDFAIRPHRHQPPGVMALAQAQANVQVYTTPYPLGITLNGLLAESLCVLQPFRLFTLQPQFSILESMAAGVPTVATNIQSVAEIIESGSNGVLIPLDDVDAATSAVEALINEPERAARMGEKAYESVREKWTWAGYSQALVEQYRAVGPA